MRRTLLLAALAPVLSVAPACSTTIAQPDAQVGESESANSTGWAGGGGNWGGGGGNWGGGGGNWGGGGGNWGGGGGLWGGGGGLWGGGSTAWGGGGGQWGGGGGYWGGGGGWWGGGGGNWGGGGGNWGGGGGLWGGGFANTFPFLGWNYARHWHFRGVPQQGYSPATPPAISGVKDTTACAAGHVRLGGFAYAMDAEDWNGYVALGYHKKLCIPTPGSHGLTMNTTVTDPTLSKLGGYALTGDLSNAGNDVTAMKTMVGWGAANVATQYAGALCASIGSLAAAKRSCGVGIAFTDPNEKKNYVGLTQRGTVINAAQSGYWTYNTPFGRTQGNSIYGAAANDMESYAGHALMRHTSVKVPSSTDRIDSWNNGNGVGIPFTGSNFQPVPVTNTPASGSTYTANATSLFNNANTSVTAPLNMIPVDANKTGLLSGNVVLTSDMQKSVQANMGDLYALSLHSLAFNQSPLYGSGGGRWFFHSPNDLNAPLMDLSSIFQGSMYILTGQLTGTPATSSVVNPYISELTLRYADWRGDSGSSLYINSAGQSPATVANDDDRALRLGHALGMARPVPNIGAGWDHTCAISSAGGQLHCWGSNAKEQLGNVNAPNTSPNPVIPTGLTSGVLGVSGGLNHSCAVMTDGRVLCWGSSGSGQSGSTLSSVDVPTEVPGIADAVNIGAHEDHSCAITQAGRVKCWGTNSYGELGNGSTYSNGVPTPVNVSGITSGAVSLALGKSHSCALLSSGAIKCWGHNNMGQLGNANTTPSAVPVLVSGISNAIAITAGDEHTCAVLLGGTVKCWGSNMSKQIGTTSAQMMWNPSPVVVTGLTGVVGIAAGAGHTCALVSNGTGIKCWGLNNYGQIGNNTSGSPVVTPVSVTGLTGSFSSIALGNSHTCARSTSGNMLCWGNRMFGQLGDGSSLGISKVPVAVNSAVNNANLIASEGSVLVTKFSSQSDPQVAGHIMPIPYSMVDSTTGKQAVIVTYDPLAAAAAEFIEQYDAHMAACNATTDTNISEDDLGTNTKGQKQGKRLWACSNPTAKAAYINGMKGFLNGARAYLFGSYKACISPNSALYDPYVACNAVNINWSQAHLPYTFWVPNYTTNAYFGGVDGSPAGYTTYFTQVNSALSSYRTSLLSSVSTRLEKTLQLAGAAKFTTDNAVVTSHVNRAGTYGTTCVSDGFTYR